MPPVSQKIITAVVASAFFLVAYPWFLSDGLSEQESMMRDDKTMIDEATARAIAKKDAMQVYVNAGLKLTHCFTF